MADNEEEKSSIDAKLDEISSKLEKISELESKIEDLSARNESLQSAWDSTLEELNLASSPSPSYNPSYLETEYSETSPEDISLENQSTPAPVENTIPTEINPVQVNPTENVRSSVSENEIASSIERSIAEDEAFRRRVEQELENQRILREEDILEDELDEALRLYPKADEDEILREIEDGSLQSVEELARRSHEEELAKEEAIKKQVEEELRGAMEREQEGSYSIPQSPASSTVSSPINRSAASPKLSEEDEWAKARQKVRSEVGES